MISSILRERFHALIAIGLVLLCCDGGLQADVTKAGEARKRKDEVSVPEAKNVSARFVAGQSVDVELHAAVSSFKQADFVIRVEPQHGTLSNLRAHPRDTNKAIITYTHGGPQGSLVDRFTYACRVDGGPYSAPATVSLMGQRMEPSLNVLEVPNFGRVFLGGEASGRVRVKNSGTAPYSMSLAWPEEWAGPPSLEVAAGETVEFTLVFRPVKQGELRYEFELQSGFPASKLVLFGEGIRPLTISPGFLSLFLDHKSGARTGVLTLANARPDKIEVRLKYPLRLQGPELVEIGPQKKLEVLLQLPIRDVASFLGEVIVETGGAGEKVAVQAEAKPAELKVVSPDKVMLDFGLAEPRATVVRDVVLANVGGEPLVVETQSRTPFTSEFNGQSLRIEPGQERRFKVSFRADRPGPVSSEMQILGGSAKAVIVLKAQVREPGPVSALNEASHGGSSPEAAAPAPMRQTGSVEIDAAPRNPGGVEPPRPQPTPPAQEAGGDPSPRAVLTPLQAAMAAYLATDGVPVSPSTINPHLDRVTQIAMLDHSSSSVTLVWQKPSVAPATWALEVSSLVRDQNTQLIVKTWTRFQQWKIVPGDADKVVVKLHSLRPGSQYEMRLLGVDREGKVSQPSPVFVVGTSEPWRVPAWVWRTLMLVALVVVIHLLYRARRGDFEFA